MYDASIITLQTCNANSTHSVEILLVVATHVGSLKEINAKKLEKLVQCLYNVLGLCINLCLMSAVLYFSVSGYRPCHYAGYIHM